MRLLDTNTLIYFFKGQGGVAERLLAQPPAEIAISTLTVFELEVGLAKSQAPQIRRQQLDEMLNVVRVLPLDTAAARASAGVRATLEAQGMPIGPLDTLIAGVAVAHGATLVTRNTREFSRIAGLNLENWYAET